MAFKAVVDSLDELPEAIPVSELYEERDGKFVMDLEAVDGLPQVSGLKSAYEKVKRQYQDARNYSGLERDGVVEKLRGLGVPDDLLDVLENPPEPGSGGGDEDALQAEIEKVKERLSTKHQRELEKIQGERDRFRKHVHKLHVENELQSAIDKLGVREELRPAVRALLRERNPQVVEEGDGFQGVFKADLDGIPGEYPIADYVSQWGKTDEAKAYLPASGRTGSGAQDGGVNPPSGGKTVKVTDGMVRVDPSKVTKGEVTVQAE